MSRSRRLKYNYFDTCDAHVGPRLCLEEAAHISPAYRSLQGYYRHVSAVKKDADCLLSLDRRSIIPRIRTVCQAETKIDRMKQNGCYAAWRKCSTPRQRQEMPRAPAPRPSFTYSTLYTPSTAVSLRSLTHPHTHTSPKSPRL